MRKLLQNLAFVASFLIGTAILGSCHSHNHKEEHEHHVLLFSAYSEDMELFAEVHPFVIGEDVTIRCHFTDLQTFKPITDSEVSFSMIGNNETISHTLKGTELPGIYCFGVNPKTEGDAKIVLKVHSANREAVFEIPGLHIYQNEDEAIEDAENREIHSANSVTFTKEMSWGVDFATSEAVRSSLGNIIHTIAQVQIANSDESVLTARVSGVVSSLSAHITEGVEVVSGQTICLIDASSLVVDNLKVEQKKAEAEMTRAKNELERLEILRADQLVVESEVQQARASFQQAQAVYESLHHDYSQGVLPVTVPRSGYLQDIKVKNGQYVNAGEVIAVLSQNRKVQLKAEVPASYYSSLAHIIGASVKSLHGNTNTWSLEELDGRLLSFGRQTSLTNPLIPVTFEINAEKELLPGSFVDMYIRTKSDKEMLCIPTGSILEDQGNYFVYVQLHPELFEKRQVLIGESDGLLTEVLSGVNLGERVVSKGAVLVKLQQATGSVDPHSGHSH